MTKAREPLTTAHSTGATTGWQVPCKTMFALRPFQREIMAAVESPEYDTVAVSIPRGNGKSFLAAHVLARGLTPGDPLHVSGSEYLLCAASIEQARLCFRFIRERLEPTGEYRWIDSATRIGIKHLASNTSLRVLSSNGKTGMGIVNSAICVADEGGSWEINGGQLMWDALTTAQGKPNSPLKLIVIGTLAPMATGAGHWFYDLIDDGTKGDVWVKTLQGDPAKWDKWNEIRRCNPLVAVDANFRKKLLSERDAARRDPRLRARFQSYRLNIPSGDESAMLLNADDLERILKRPVPPREGRPVVGVDMGENRAWCAATAWYPNGRLEAVAIAPGVPDIQAQEVRDRVPRGTYARLVETGKLIVADGWRVPPATMMADLIRTEFGTPTKTLLDRFRLYQLEDCSKGLRLESRVTRYSEASADIRALRKYAKDGPLAVDRDSRLLLTASLTAAQVENDTSGNTRMYKRNNNVGRDDVAAAAVLCAGEIERIAAKPIHKMTVGIVR